MDEYTGNLKMYSIRNYRSQMDNHILPSLGAVKLTALSTHMIQKLYNSLQKELSAKTIKNIHGIIHRALEQAVMLGYIRANPSGMCKLPRVVKKPVAPLSDEQITTFWEANKGHPLENLFIVDLFTGMRQGELLGMTWDSVDFDRGIIHVERQLYQPAKGGTYTFETLKNGKTRSLTPATFVMQALKDERRKQLEARLRAGEAWDEGIFKGLVFTNELGHHLAHGTVYNKFKAIVRRMWIPTARFHDMSTHMRSQPSGLAMMSRLCKRTWGTTQRRSHSTSTATSASR